MPIDNLQTTLPQIEEDELTVSLPSEDVASSTVFNTATTAEQFNPDTDFEEQVKIDMDTVMSGGEEDLRRALDMIQVGNDVETMKNVSVSILENPEIPLADKQSDLEALGALENVRMNNPYKYTPEKVTASALMQEGDLANPTRDLTLTGYMQERLEFEMGLSRLLDDQRKKTSEGSLLSSIYDIGSSFNPFAEIWALTGALEADGFWPS